MTNNDDNNDDGDDDNNKETFNYVVRCTIRMKPSAQL